MNIITAGFPGTVQLDAHTAIMTLLEFLYISFPFGIATSATIRVGNLLGAGRPHEARIAGERGGCLSICTLVANTHGSRIVPRLGHLQAH